MQARANADAIKKACSRPYAPINGAWVQSRPGCGNQKKHCCGRLAFGNNFAQLGVQGIAPYAQRLGGLQHVAAIVL